MKLTLEMIDHGTGKQENKKVKYQENPIWLLIGHSQNPQVRSIDEFLDPITEEPITGRIYAVPVSFGMVPLIPEQGLCDLFMKYDQGASAATHYASEKKWRNNSQFLPAYLEPESLIPVNTTLRRSIGESYLELNLIVPRTEKATDPLCEFPNSAKTVYSPTDLPSKYIKMVLFPKRWQNGRLSGSFKIETTDGSYAIENTRLSPKECRFLLDTCQDLLQGAGQTLRKVTKDSIYFLSSYMQGVHRIH